MLNYTYVCRFLHVIKDDVCTGYFLALIGHNAIIRLDDDVPK